ncbi:MAG: 16S rRNA (uracil(1498)-N(3))-methyltransferase [Gammaproteobacteria bacterium]
MRLSRIYTSQALGADKELVLEDSVAHYVGKVLRLRINDQISLFNERDGEYLFTISDIAKKSVTALLENKIASEAESPLAIHLGLGISRGERMDYAIQKATELGVTSIFPLFTERCEVKIKADRLDNRMTHWERVAISACEQSGRCAVPKIHTPVQLDEWLRQDQTGDCFVLDHRGDNGLPTGRSPNAVTFLIGPEGGLSESEIASANTAEFTSLRLGPRVLRTETAPVVAISLAQQLWGDF